MLINELAEYCNSRYNRTGRCPDCPNADCQNGCEACLDAIHFNKITRPYNCENITNFYVCKYIYKYSTEIDRLIARLGSLRDFENYNILSLGCGPCTELAGIVNFLLRIERDRPVTFMGIDTNEFWRPIHDKITEIAANYAYSVTVKFIYDDALKIIRQLDLQNIKWRPNILVLQYFISDLVNIGIRMRDFLKELNSTIISYMPINSYIILNDINHYKIRHHFESLARIVADHFQTEVSPYHFINNNRKFYRYGEEHRTNLLTSTIPSELKTQYNPWESCSSAQIVIKRGLSLDH